MFPAFLVSLLLAVTPPEQWLAQGDEAFAAGVAGRAQPRRARAAFQQAAQAFALVQKAGCWNAALLSNRGKAELLAERLPQAILAWEQALRLEPGAGEVRDCLDYARAQVQYPGEAGLGRPPADHWPPWLPRWSTPVLLWLTALAHALAWGLGLRWWLSGREHALVPVVVAVSLALVLLLGLAWRWQTEAQAHDFPLVVIAFEGVPLRQGNGTSYLKHPELPRLGRGMEARLLHRRGGWLQIEFATGQVGWIPAPAALVAESD